MKLRLFPIATLLLAVTIVPACSDDDDDNVPEQQPSQEQGSDSDKDAEASDPSESETPAEPEDNTYVLNAADIHVTLSPDGNLVATVGQPFVVEVSTVTDEGITYQWACDGTVVSDSKECNYAFPQAGEYALTLSVSQGDTVSIAFQFDAVATFEPIDAPDASATPYVTKVLDYLPAPGQFTNTLPEYEEGDTQEDMNRKCLENIGNNEQIMISLGGWGGYVVVGFDHTIQNVSGKRDFLVLGNAFQAATNPDEDNLPGGSCEPGIIMVAYDVNHNGVPDDNEWYEIAGSAHHDATAERFYAKGLENGNDMATIFDYEMTYHRPLTEENDADFKSGFFNIKNYIAWEDNQGNSGYKVKNTFHKQTYYPQWVTDDQITFRGTRLPENGIDESGAGNYFVLYKFLYGYSDNEPNTDDNCGIDIDWAVNAKNQKVHLPGVDFIKVYTGVNQENGWLGECSTEVMGVNDLHLLGKEIDTL